MGENKGHGNKAPNYPEIDEMDSTANRTGQGAGNQQSAGSQRDAGKQQSNSEQQGSKQQGSQQQGSKQQDAGSKQDAGGQRQNQQKGGQHASGGTPALEDLNAGLDSRHQGPLGNAPQQMDQQSDWNGELGKNR